MNIEREFDLPYGPHEGPDRDNPNAPGMPVALTLVALAGLIVTASLLIWRQELLELCAQVLKFFSPR